MNIVHKGNIELYKMKKRAIKKFSCRECGCIFEAEKGEYECGYDQRDPYYSCRCPCCNEFVYTD